MMTEVIIGTLQVEVVRKNIRSLRLTVYAPDGRIRVAVPTRTSAAVVEEFVLARRVWIEKHQARFKARGRPAELAYAAGEIHYYQGQRHMLRVHLTTGAPRVQLGEEQTLDLFVREGSTREQREKVLAAWYRKQLKAQLPALVAQWQPVVGVRAEAWAVKRMKTRWGTCNIRAKRIWLNLELIKWPCLCLEYVVVHELVHLHERLHNARFWGLMDEFMPDWRTHREELKKLPTATQMPEPDAC